MRHRGQRLRLQREQASRTGVASRSFGVGTQAGGPLTSRVRSEAASVLDLQARAGNRAVAARVGSWRNGRVVIGASNVLNVHPMGPADGVRKIRESRGGGGLLGRTVASIDPVPPLLRPEAPAKTDAGWTTRAIPAPAPEPYLEEYWPTAGRHEMYPNIYLDVSPEWEERIKAGEDEHVADHMLGWRSTWATVADAIGELSKAPGSPKATEDAARADLWKRFVCALPADLRPAGAQPTDEAQTARWGFEPSTTMFRRLFEATVARDRSGWHTTTSELDHAEGPNEYRQVAGDTHIGETSSEDLIGQARAKAGRRG